MNEWMKLAIVLERVNNSDLQCLNWVNNNWSQFFWVAVEKKWWYWEDQREWFRGSCKVSSQLSCIYQNLFLKNYKQMYCFISCKINILFCYFYLSKGVGSVLLDLPTYLIVFVQPATRGSRWINFTFKGWLWVFSHFLCVANQNQSQLEHTALSAGLSSCSNQSFSGGAINTARYNEVRLII